MDWAAKEDPGFAHAHSVSQSLLQTKQSLLVLRLEEWVGIQSRIMPLDALGVAVLNVGPKSFIH